MELKNMEITEVSLVDSPANKRKKFLIFKRKEMDMNARMKELLKKLGEGSLTEDESKELSAMGEKFGEDFGKSIMEELQKFNTEGQKTLSSISDTITELSKKIDSFIETLTKEDPPPKKCSEEDEDEASDEEVAKLLGELIEEVKTLKETSVTMEEFQEAIKT